MRRSFDRSALICFLLFSFFVTPMLRSQQQQPVLNKDDQYKISVILQWAHDDVKSHYYDPRMHGLDWDARYKEYKEKIATAHSLGEGYRIVEAFLSGLKDSHTSFWPPPMAAKIDYGFRYKMIGEDCFITELRPKSEAESKLHIGDQIMQLDGYAVNRDDYHDLWKFLNTLSPRGSSQLVVKSPTGEERQEDVKAVIGKSKLVLDYTKGADLLHDISEEQNDSHDTRGKIVEKDDLAIWRLTQFDHTDDIAHAIRIAKKDKALIIDLRGNGGGYVNTLITVVQGLFDHDVKICDRIHKNWDGTPPKPEPVVAHHNAVFSGKLIVLVDSGSASASEILARVVQLEHRGIVIGDKTMGAVMESSGYPHLDGTGNKIFFGFSITDADLIMTDGKSLEKVGVTPDEIVLPTAADLAAGRDSVLVHAAAEAGVTLDPIEAGKMFPFVWPPIDGVK